MKQIPWIIPPAILLTLAGWTQAAVLLVFGFIPDKQHKDWKSMHAVTALAFGLVWSSFWFTSKPPQAHIYYILLPLISVYSFYVWGRLAVKRGWKIFGIICLCTSFWFELSYLIYQMPMTTSLYNNRALVVKAIDQKDYRILGERRPGSHN